MIRPLWAKGERPTRTVEALEYVADPPTETLVRLVVQGEDRLQRPRLHGRDEFPSADTAFPAANSFPKLIVQQLRDVVAAPRHVVLDSTCTQVFPQTFKKHRNHRHMGVKHLEGERFRLKYPFEYDTVQDLPGTSYYLDCEFEDIYGHNLIEVWPQLWALSLLPHFDDLHFVTSIRLKPYVLQVLELLGAPSDRVVHLDHPVRCERLLVPTPAIKARRYVHPVSSTIFDKISTLRFSDVPPDPALAGIGSKIYLSRAGLDERRLANEAEIEALVTEFGFSVVRPEAFSLEDQMRMYAQATHLIGPGGSGMHNAVFAPRGTRVMILASSAWFTVIDILLAQNRYDLSYVFGDPVEPTAPGQRGKMTWALDARAVRQALEQFVAS